MYSKSCDCADCRALTVLAEVALAESRTSNGGYHCPCGWSRVVLTTAIEAKRDHEKSMVHTDHTLHVA